ncbi:hypothetical protein GG681_00975 [Epibacterium sp. SM1969]|uniref:Uncharacterized protein n=1 Tax=Tritonibacter aquimaris TaxID=2663379 RepID=A0A844ATE5_9RHOB|nr:hypothetical protein [Tritonibacter aquimaris]MQY41202.1 hypothetical protein [Tritonibacter aquimaris]
MRVTLLFFYHLSLRMLAILGLPLLVLLSHQTLTTLVDTGAGDVWPRIILVAGTAPLCVFFAIPSLLPARLRQPDLRELGPFLFVGLGLIGFAVMSVARAAVSELAPRAQNVEFWSAALGAAAILIGGTAGLLALTLSNQAPESNIAPRRTTKRAPRPSSEELRAMRHARMQS